MQNTDKAFYKRLTVLQQPHVASTLRDIQHGIERESLRINPNGTLASTDHPAKLGSALTHHFITTDFSESLMEFITPPESCTQKTLQQLQDIHKFVVHNIDEEMLWPMSMPCFIKNQDEIRLAYYGESNVGRMKTLYRQGLKNRYGSMMQAIAGVHFNFSLPGHFWTPYLSEALGQSGSQQDISAAYMGLVRNYRRICWLIPYLYGSSPALCSSFLQGKSSNLPFEEIGKGSIYLKGATSLRMSDLGYTNNAQSSLQICYNELDAYVVSLRQAIQTPSPRFERFNGKHNGLFQQLNGNLLQIENELYSPIRPKQPTRSLEKPTDALDDRGVSYIEVRALDVNPFSPVGVEAQQIHFLDVFLLHCLLRPSAPFATGDFEETEHNIKVAVETGRCPEATLSRAGQPVLLRDWAKQLVAEMQPLAELLDNVNRCKDYTQALAGEMEKILEPELTFSGRILNMLQEQKLDNGELAISLAEQHKRTLMDAAYTVHSEEFFVQQAELSQQARTKIEANDKIDFDTFMRQQFGV
ncbi:glutamate--cysteine ligase [Planctobacterium marinum]|uniref:Glutamate--cysteine ligase n=1 Tax=Planctobacterium marinum TaxID=1631968 RepID=A0AA48KTG8_9ALTE|nr:glutamate--cysteine ligase [Planctobacterium marinum]